MPRATGLLLPPGGQPTKTNRAALGDYSPEKLLKQLQAAQDRANKENEKRYQEGLAELTGGRVSMRELYEQAAGNLAKVGGAAAEDVSRGATRTGATGMQGLISAGLGNTTITGSLARGVEEDRRRGMRTVEEDQARRMAGLQTTRAGAEMGAAGNLAQFMAARSDQGPDLGMYGSLIQQASAGGPEGQQTIHTGLSPNARAGLDAFGRPMGRYGGGGGGSISGAGGGGYAGPAGSTGGGGGGGGAPGSVYYGPGAMAASARAPQTGAPAPGAPGVPGAPGSLAAAGMGAGAAAGAGAGLPAHFGLMTPYQQAKIRAKQKR